MSELNSIKSILFECKKIALSKVYIPKRISEKYNFVINEEDKECYINKNESL